VPVPDLVAAAAVLDGGSRGLPTFDATDERFLHPDDMLTEVTDALGIDRASPAPFVTRCMIESMVCTTAAVLDRLGPIRGINLFGGAARLDLLRERLAAVTGLPVAVGPAEAAVVGNALVQGIALGAFTGLADARAALAAS
jgi:rhamnulokinase